jgi:tripartite-type tricarboxylate transporter receptor subunit TctC
MGAVEDKRINLLGTNGLQRSPMAPNVPPISDVVADFDFSVLVGILARSGTPKDVIAKVSSAAMAVVKMDAVAKQYAAAGIEQTSAGPAEFQQALSRETERVTKVIKASGITIK